MAHLKTIYLFALLLVIAACTSQTAAPPSGAIMTTPVDDLPVSILNPNPPIDMPTAVPDSIVQEADADYLVLSNVYERSITAIVNIEGVTQTSGEPRLSRGSGFVFDMQGHIITNAHVIKDADTVRVTFNDGYVTEGQVVGFDTFSDLGLVRVQVPSDRLHPLTLMADSDLVRVGQRAIAIGNPFGLNSSMSAGIVSGLGRTLRSAELIDSEAPVGFQNPAIIQTDTPINPGNSGGPLLNSQGEVMGVTTAIRTESGVFQGVGFAVPTNTVRRVIPELIQTGQVNYAWLGIFVTPEDNGYSVAGLAEALNLPVDAGVLLRGVTIGSPADRSGLRGGREIIDVRGQAVCIGGDIIVAINGVYVANMDDLVAYLLAQTRPNDRITLLIVRDRETFEIELTLQVRPNQETQVRDCVG
ncbi:MAG: trypsin-like peptidase domain-containing protein [Anaerolineae bacterium]|nr:trypsin-like peptidase domain-containing protein [Anaerolineae bacterium]